MEAKHVLNIYNSKPDVHGNRYWAFTFLHESGKEIKGYCGAASDGNIRGMTYHTGLPNEWDRTIIVNTYELPIRQFNALKKGWEFAGNMPERIADWVRAELAKEGVTYARPRKIDANSAMILGLGPILQEKRKALLEYIATHYKDELSIPRHIPYIGSLKEIDERGSVSYHGPCDSYSLQPMDVEGMPIESLLVIAEYLAGIES